jgi:ankyrin repeat protein
LSYAIGNDWPDTVKFLISKGASINGNVYQNPIFINQYGEDNDRQKTMLMTVAFIGDTGMLDLIIDKVSDLNAQNINGRTALMFAARCAYTKKAAAYAVAQLLKQGAQKNIKDNDGKTAYQLAIEAGNEEAAQLLK